MDYPLEFPQGSRARVDAAKVTAEREFARAEQSIEDSLNPRKYQSAVDRLIKDYVTSVLFVFADESIQIGKKGIWTAICIQSEVEDFGRDIISGAQGKCYHRNGIAFTRTYPWEFSVDIWREIKSSERWLAFLDRTAELAEAQAAATTSDPVNFAKVGNRRPDTWRDINIEFLSDERIQIHTLDITNTTTTLNYAEFGFEDRRNEKPNQAWVTLRTLAEQRGILRQPTNEGQKWSDVEKRVQEIRRIFRKYFGVMGDPLPFVKRLGYQAQFKIGCAQSYKT